VSSHSADRRIAERVIGRECLESKRSGDALAGAPA